MFEIQVNTEGDILLTGRFDAAQVARAKEVFDHIDSGCTVDFKDLQYISSAGLGELLSVQKRLMNAGSGLRLINMNEHIQDIFRFAGFDKVFEIG